MGGTLNILNFIAGKYEKQYEYESFFPEKINHCWELSDPKTQMLLDDATRLLGELNAFSQLIPDVDFFISMHTVKEATSSSRIEGTQTNMEDAFIAEADVHPEKRDDWAEVQNYIEAMSKAMTSLKDLPLSNRLLKNTHKVLMQGVRGRNKQPGEFRLSQNWIGTSLKNATFIPPHHDRVLELMSDLEACIHNDKVYLSPLIKIAIVHYQFETIHPFLDGNGRLGRMLIVLYLVNCGLLDKPSLYLSDFFEKHKSLYYEHLMSVRMTHSLDAWVQFFLIGVKETAESSIAVFKAILALRANIETERLPRINIRKQENAHHLMRHLYGLAVVRVNDVSKLLSVQHNVATSLVKDFEKFGILKEMTGQKRNKLYIFEEYVQLFKT